MPEHVTLYHGTSTLHLPNIKAEGLRPNAAAGVDDDAESIAAILSKLRHPSVYVTTNQSRALVYATSVARKHAGASPVVLEMHIPKAMFGMTFVEDEFCRRWVGGVREDYRTEQIISPGLIDAITLPDEIAAQRAFEAVSAEEAAAAIQRDREAANQTLELLTNPG